MWHVAKSITLEFFEVSSLPETIKKKSTFRAKTLSLKVGGRGKARIFIRFNTKTLRYKIETNQMDLNKTKCKRNVIDMA